MLVFTVLFFLRYVGTFPLKKGLNILKWVLLWILEKALGGLEVAADLEQHPGWWRSVCAA